MELSSVSLFKINYLKAQRLPQQCLSVEVSTGIKMERADISKRVNVLSYFPLVLRGLSTTAAPDGPVNPEQGAAEPDPAARNH